MLQKKYFLITVDTEGDNLWSWKEGDRITVENGRYVEPFQALCEEFGFLPTYFVNYEVASDDFFAGKLKSVLDRNACEIGVHLHAWNTPPQYELEMLYDGQPYLVEYPEEIMRAKFDQMFTLLTDKFGSKPLSHRAGRWAMDERYFKILRDFGIIADCSYTPGVSWTGSCGRTIAGGSDYSSVGTSVRMIDDVMEIPVTIRKIHHCSEGSIKHRARTLLEGEDIWLRPSLCSYSAMRLLLDKVNAESGSDYVEFMIHSSELMRGGSIYFRTEEDMRLLYDRMRKVFCYAASLGYCGCTVSEYAKLKRGELC